MKKIFIVVNKELDGKNYAFADTLRTGENLAAHIKRYNSNIVHLCESRELAENIAIEWNNWNTTRHERFTIEDEIVALQARADRVFKEYVRNYDKYLAMKAAVDVIIYISNYGGEVTPQNRRQIEDILNI